MTTVTTAQWLECTSITIRAEFSPAMCEIRLASSKSQENRIEVVMVQSPTEVERMGLVVGYQYILSLARP